MREPQDSGTISSSLVDLDPMDLGDLTRLGGDSVLVGALQKLQLEAARPDEAVAGFGSSL